MDKISNYKRFGMKPPPWTGEPDFSDPETVSWLRVFAAFVAADEMAKNEKVPPMSPILTNASSFTADWSDL